MRRTVISSLVDTQQSVARQARTLEHVWVTNLNASVVYLHLWDVNDATPGAQVIGDRTDMVAVAANYSGPIYFEMGVSQSLVLSATTAANLTGTPGAALVLSLRWR